MIVEFIGRHGEVLKRIVSPQLCTSVSIREEILVPDKEHFPDRPAFPAWNPKRKVADLPKKAG